MPIYTKYLKFAFLNILLFLVSLNTSISATCAELQCSALNKICVSSNTGPKCADYCNGEIENVTFYHLSETKSPTATGDRINTWVNASNAFESDNSFAASKAAPSPPHSLRVSGISFEYINLSWKPAVDGEPIRIFNVYRNGTLIAIVNSTSYSGTGQYSYTTYGNGSFRISPIWYSYTVTSTGLFGLESAQSQPLIVQTKIPPPQAPSFPSAKALSNTEINLSWDYRFSGQLGVDYKIYRDGTLVGTTSGNYFIDSGLIPYSRYLYNISAINEYGDSSANSSILGISDATPPVIFDGRPYGTIEAKISPSILYFNFITDEPASCRYSNAPNTPYNSMSGFVSQYWNNNTFYRGSVTVQFGRTYTYYIKCRDIAGNTNSEDYPITFTYVRDMTPPLRSNGRPSGILPTSTAFVSLSLTTDETASCRYASIPNLPYDLMRNAMTASAFNAHSFTITGLSYRNSTTYYIKCRDSFNNTNADNYIINFSIAPPDRSPPSLSDGTPKGLLPSSTTSAQLTFNTDEPAVCKYSTLPNKTYASMAIIIDSYTKSSHSYNVSFPPLRVTNTFTYYIKCIDVNNNFNTDDYIINFSIAPPDRSPPVRTDGAPRGILSAGTASIVMSLKTDELSFCKFSPRVWESYTVMLNNFSTLDGLLHTTNLAGLQNDRSYTYYVKCTDNFNNVNSDNFVINFSIASGGIDRTPPTSPSSIMAAGVSSNQINLTWTGSTDNVGVAGYKILRNWANIINTTSTFYSDSGLTPDTSYSYRISAYDAARLESLPATINVITPNAATGQTSASQWIQTTNNANWSRRSGHSSVVFNNKMWVIGGIVETGGYGYKNDVWHSSNGVAWNRATPSASWDARTDHSSLVFNNKMWVIGGQNSSPSNNLKNDVWYSSDGINWNRATSNAPWLPRRGHASVVFNNKMWVIGGDIRSNTKVNDVWSSADGIVWTRATGNALWENRSALTSLVFNNKIWILGGSNNSIFTSSTKNDAWSSADGVIWIKATANATWTPRAYHSSVVFNSKMWVIGGANGISLTPLRDVWSSADGINWILNYQNPPWGNRKQHTSLEFNNNIWVLGGYAYNDVWRTNLSTSLSNQITGNTISGKMSSIVGRLIAPNTMQSLGKCRLYAELSWNNGSSYTSTGYSSEFGNEISVITFGNSSALWGREWAPSDFSNNNIRVKLSNNRTNINAHDYYNFNFPDFANSRIDGIKVEILAKCGNRSIIYVDSININVDYTKKDIRINYYPAAPVGGCSASKKYCSPQRTFVNRCDICGCNEGENCTSSGKCVSVCSDGTEYGKCSLQKPLYCDNGNLTQKSEICGCSEGKYPVMDGTCAPKWAVEVSTQNDFSKGAVESGDLRYDKRLGERASIVNNNFEDIALSGQAFASSIYEAPSDWSYRPIPSCANNGNYSSPCEWVSNVNPSGYQKEQYLGIMWDTKKTFSQVKFVQSYLHVRSYKIQYLKDGSWIDLTREKFLKHYPLDYTEDLANADKSKVRGVETAEFEPIAAKAVRILFPQCYLYCRIFKVEIYNSANDSINLNQQRGFNSASYVSEIFDTESKNVRYDKIYFNYSIEPVIKSKSINIAPQAAVETSSSQTFNEYPQVHMSSLNDESFVKYFPQLGGNYYGLWESAKGSNQWIKFNFPQKKKINKIVLWQLLRHIKNYEVKAWDGSKWRIIAKRDNLPHYPKDYSDDGVGYNFTGMIDISFDTVETDKIQVLFPECVDYCALSEVSIYEDSSSIALKSSNIAPYGTAFASSYYTDNYGRKYEAAAINDLGSRGIWDSSWMPANWNSQDIFGIEWAAPRTISKVRIDYAQLAIPSQYCYTHFYLEYWDGSTWQKIIKSSICDQASWTGNWDDWAIEEIFEPITTTKIRLRPEPFWWGYPSIKEIFVYEADSPAPVVQQSSIMGSLNYKVAIADQTANKTWNPLNTVIFKDKMWVVGGYNISQPSYVNKVWSSNDGVAWTKETDSIPWASDYVYSNSGNYKAFVFNNKLWVISKGRIWSSNDGNGWIDATPIMWSPRAKHASLVFTDPIDNVEKIWVMGGEKLVCRNSTCRYEGVNDIWSSEDGTIWTKVADAPWKGRYGLASVVFRNKIWVIGGYNGTSSFYDVWSSEDGRNWVLMNFSAPFGYSVNSVIHDNKLWIISGNKKVWSSSNGVEWALVNANASWDARNDFASVAYNNKMWLFAGESFTGNGFIQRNDVWSSSDGVTWAREPDAPWTGRTSISASLYNNKIWVTGGVKKNYNPQTTSSGATVYYFKNQTVSQDMWTFDGNTWAQEPSNLARHDHSSLVFKNQLWVIGGYILLGNDYSYGYGDRTERSDKIFSFDGIKWNEKNQPAISLQEGTPIVFNNKVWLIGNSYPYSQNLLALKPEYYVRNNTLSFDGVRWTKEESANEGFGARQGYSALTYNGKMWVIGGKDKISNTLKNDVWSSHDGITWTKELDNAPWQPRMYHKSFIYDNKMWIVGGSTIRVDDYGRVASKIPLDEAWYSNDGKRWTQASIIPWLETTDTQNYYNMYFEVFPDAIVYNNTVWFVRGSKVPGNDLIAASSSPVSIQIRTADSFEGEPQHWTNFQGPDGTQSTFYRSSGLPINTTGKSTSAYSTPTASDEMHNAWQNPQNAFLGDGEYAASPSGFNGCIFNVDMSWDGGNSYNPYSNVLSLQYNNKIKADSDGFGQIFGRRWISNDLTNDNYRLRISKWGRAVGTEEVQIFYNFNFPNITTQVIPAMEIIFNGKCSRFLLYEQALIDSIQIKIPYLDKNVPLHDGNQFIQFKATLTSPEPDKIVSLNDVKIIYAGKRNSKPMVTAKDKEGITGVPFNFTAIASDFDGIITSYIWSFGDNQTGIGRNISHIYNEAGEYGASVKVIDNGGSSATAKFKVYVNKYNCLEQDDYDNTPMSGPAYSLFTPNDIIIKQKASEALFEYAQENGMILDDIDTTIEYFEAANKYMTKHMTYLAEGPTSSDPWNGASAKKLFTESGDLAKRGASCGNDYCGDCEDFAITTEALIRAMGISPKCAYVACSYIHCWNILNIGGKFRIVEPQESNLRSQSNSKAYEWTSQGYTVYAANNLFNDEIGRFAVPNDASPQTYTLNYPGISGLPDTGNKCPASYSSWASQGDKTYFEDICP